jgi:uncharacterized protein|tara:strand:+ start:2022 stop:2810 length:789 start_codon:yes stop_codon:yes gene_type:complete
MNTLNNLVDWFRDKDGVLVAFSGGVDSSVVAKAALLALGKKAIAATANSVTLSENELYNAKKLAKEIGIEHIIFRENEFENPNFAENPVNRCYYCRNTLISGLNEIAKQKGIPVIVDGSNHDDLKAHRPGMLAMKENGVKSPFLELQFGKNDVRNIAKELNLSVADKPSMACLASRIPYGETITVDKLNKIEKAENFLRILGFKEFRVRFHGGIARIELREHDLSKTLKNRRKITTYLKDVGFSYVTLDLEGYRSGSMDEVL